MFTTLADSVAVCCLTQCFAAQTRTPSRPRGRSCTTARSIAGPWASSHSRSLLAVRLLSRSASRPRATSFATATLSCRAFCRLTPRTSSARRCARRPPTGPQSQSCWHILGWAQRRAVARCHLSLRRYCLWRWPAQQHQRTLSTAHGGPCPLPRRNALPPPSSPPLHRPQQDCPQPGLGASCERGRGPQGFAAWRSISLSSKRRLVCVYLCHDLLCRLLLDRVLCVQPDTAHVMASLSGVFERGGPLKSAHLLTTSTSATSSSMLRGRLC